MEYDDALSKRLQNCARDHDEDETVGKDIVDNFIEFFPEDNIKGMVYLNRDPVLYNLGNARLDLKKAILAGVEFVASINRPESIFNYIQLLIVSVLFIRSATRQELDDVEAHIIYLLHLKETYKFGIEEKKFIQDIQEWYRQRGNSDLSQEKIEASLNHLHEMKVVDIIDAKIYLKEKVWGQLR